MIERLGDLKLVTNHLGRFCLQSGSGRLLRSPLGNEYQVPSEELGELLRQELQGKLPGGSAGDKPIITSVTRALALESDSGQLADCKASLLKYLSTDTLLYRPDRPEYDEQWDPVVRQYCTMTGEQLVSTRTLFQATQDADFRNSRSFIHGFDAWKTAALELSARSLRSFILALLLVQGECSDEQAIDLALLETAMQTKKWGVIEDEHVLERKRLLMTQRLALLLLINNQ